MEHVPARAQLRLYVHQCVSHRLVLTDGHTKLLALFGIAPGLFHTSAREAECAGGDLQFFHFQCFTGKHIPTPVPQL
jgi:hypothetical protein